MIRVVTDSACDLPQELADQLEVEIVPLSVRFGDEEFVDRRDLSPKEFWARCGRSPVLPETAAPSPGAFEAAYQRAAEAGADGVVCLTLSSSLSATYQSAQLAAEQVADDLPVQVVDSRSLTMGLGVIVVEAARAAQAGKGMRDVVAVADHAIPRTRVYAALDTLENLKKGGRIGGAQAFLGSMLAIKPVIEVSSGEVEQESRQRTRSRALRYLAQKVHEAGPIRNLAILHGDAPDADVLVEQVSDVFPRKDIIVGQIGPIIGAHAGPRAIGVTFQVAG